MLIDLGHGSYDLSTLEFSCQDEANQCDLTTEKGLKCRKCRLMRCLEVGLKPEKVILDVEGRMKFTGLKYFVLEWFSLLISPFTLYPFELF